jgi:putative ABC transport system substrate-binding protein
LLRELCAPLTKIGVLVLRLQWENYYGDVIRLAAESAGVSCLPVLLDPPTNDAAYRGAITNASRDGSGAMLVLESTDALEHQAAIVEAAAAVRLPTMYFLREFVDVGGLLAYAFDLVTLQQVTARYIEAILRGTNPGDIPFFQPSKFNLYINLKTANELGLAVPQMLLVQADDIVE